MKDSRGFSLVELLIVVAIITLIMAIAVPGLVRAKQFAQSGSAIQSLRTMTTAEHLYLRQHRKYATLLELSPEGTIDSALSVGLKSGYGFVLTVTGVETDTEDKKHFACTADPVDNPLKSLHFFVDETAVIRSEYGKPADVNSPPIPR